MIDPRQPPFRIAAIGDLHIRTEAPRWLHEQLDGIAGRADVLVITGDITNHGRLTQAEIAADALRGADIPIIAVLGNHDRRCIRRRAFHSILERVGVTFIDGETFVLDSGRRLGFAGVGGSGGGFWPDEGPDTLPRRACQRLAIRARWEAARLDSLLDRLDTDAKVVVTHYAPTIATLGREPVLKQWLLGNMEIGRVIDRHTVDLVLHGHAHLGNPMGFTAGGTLVRNVAQDVSGGLVIHELALPVRTIGHHGLAALVEARA
ncbi:MAG: metallophosphoesterase family protein [Thermomicrobiales bacterium]